MNEMRQKIELMSKERVDLELAIEKLKSGIFELNKEGRQRLKDSFELVNKNFKNLLKAFGGGDAELKLVGDDDPLKAGLEILASPPGKNAITFLIVRWRTSFNSHISHFFCFLM